MNDHNPWERIDGEPHRWFRRFEAYRLMGPGRSLVAACNQERVAAGKRESPQAPGSWRAAARDWGWKARAESWDQHLIEEVEARWRAQIMGPTEVLARLSEQGKTNIADFVSEDPRLITKGSGENAEEFFIESGTLNWEKIRENGHLIKKISFNQYGPIIEMYSAQEALGMMGKYHKLFTDKVDLTSGGETINNGISDDRFDRALSSFADAIREVLPRTSAGPESPMDTTEQAAVASISHEGG